MEDRQMKILIIIFTIVAMLFMGCLSNTTVKTDNSAWENRSSHGNMDATPQKTKNSGGDDGNEPGW